MNLSEKLAAADGTAPAPQAQPPEKRAFHRAESS